MGWDDPALLSVLSEMFCRRPLDVKTSGGGPVCVSEGYTTNFAIVGKYLEGKITLYANSNRVSFSNIQQHGSGEQTSVTADITALPDSGNVYISVWGFTNGQDQNPTARFDIFNAINIINVVPRLHGVSYRMVDYRIPEAIEFTLTATSDVKAIILTVDDGSQHVYSGLQFIYTFKKSGIRTVSFQGKTATGELSNILSTPLLVYRRPRVNYINIRPNNNTGLVSDIYNNHQLYFISSTNSHIVGDPPAYKWGDRISHMPTRPINYGGWATSRIFIDLGYYLGDFQEPISWIEVKAGFQGYPYVPATLKNLVKKNVNLLEVEYQPYIFAPSLLTIWVTPYNTMSCRGITQEIQIEIVPAGGYFTLVHGNYMSYPPPLDDPTPPWVAFNGFPTLLNAYGKIVSPGNWQKGLLGDALAIPL